MTDRDEVEVEAVAPGDDRRLRMAVAGALACATAIFTFAGAMGVTLRWPLAAAVAIVVAAATAVAFWRYPVVRLHARACPRVLRIAAAVATVVAAIQLIRLCLFIVVPSQVSVALGPARGLGLAVAHSCLSAYVVAADAIDTTPNVYDDALYSLPSDAPGARRRPRLLDAFNVDVYEYPPPFLLLSRALARLAPEFLRQRMLWFAVEGLVILVGMLVVVSLLAPVAGTRALLLSPFLWASDLTIGTLQIGNVQPVVIALAVLAMALFERRRYAAGGLLLAFVTVSKLFPGLLLVYLLVRRDWRALAWTAAAGVALLAASLLDTGLAPYQAFLEHLPGLMGGEAFPAFRNPGAIAKNYSVPGMVFKPALFGIGDLSFGAAKLVGWLYTLVILAVTMTVARRPWSRAEAPLIWLAVLTLATLRSPFLPPYAVFPALWLLTLLAARVTPTPKALGLALAGWAALNVAISQNTVDPRLISVVVLIPQGATLAVALLALRAPATRDVGRGLPQPAAAPS